MDMYLWLCEKQGLYDRPDGPRRRFPGHWPNPGAEALAVAEAGSLAGAKMFFTSTTDKMTLSYRPRKGSPHHL